MSPVFFFFLSPVFLILLLLSCLLAPFSLSPFFVFSSYCLFPFSFLLTPPVSSWLLLSSLPSVRPPVPSVTRLSISLASLLASVISFFFFLFFSFLYSSIALLQSHLVGGLPSLPALLLSSLPVFLSDRFLLGNAGFRHLCFRFRHLLHCSCPIPGPPPPHPFLSFPSPPSLLLPYPWSPPPPFFLSFLLPPSLFPPYPWSFPLPFLFSSFFFSSLVPLFPTCHLYLLFLDLLFLLSFPRIFSRLVLLFLVLWFRLRSPSLQWTLRF